MIPLRNLKRFFYKALKQPGYAFKVAFRRLAAAAYYSFSGGRSAPPEAITFFLTHRCNLHCKMCGQWGEMGITKKQPGQYIKEELPLDKIKALISEVAVFQPNITLFGGEPLLHSGCAEIIKYIKQKKMHCLMITNGSLLRDFAENLVSVGLDELNVSLDGKGALHDEIRGQPGLYQRIIDGLQQVEHFKKQQGKRKPLVNLQCTVSKYNYSRLEQMLEVAREVAADALTFHNLIFLSRDLIEKQKKYDQILGCSSTDWEGFAAEAGIDPDKLDQKITAILKGKYPFAVDFYPNFSFPALKEYYSDAAIFPSGYPCRCLSPWIAAYIFPDGQLRPCLNCSYSFGNIQKNKFLSLWNSPAAQKYRRLLKEARVFPVCARCTELYRY